MLHEMCDNEASQHKMSLTAKHAYTIGGSAYGYIIRPRAGNPVGRAISHNHFNSKIRRTRGVQMRTIEISSTTQCL